MANKGFSKFVSGLGAKTAKVEKSDKTLSKENREREVILREKLSALLDDLQYDPKIQRVLKNGWASKDEILQTQKILAQVIRDLETPRVTEQDEKGLDDLIIGFADALRYAVQNGYRNMYDWANFAVSKATLTLHVDVPEHDRQYASQLYDQKLKYAETLKILIEAAKERDVAESAYNAELLIREKLVEEHKTRMNRHKALKLRPEGPQLIAAAKEKAGNPVTMTEEEREVYDNVFRISEVKRLLRNAENQMGIQLHLLKTKEELIESTRQQLAVPPHTENPQLAAEFSVINKYFLDRLRASVDRAMHIRRVVDEYSDGLASIHEVVQRARAAEVRATIDDIEMQSVEAAQVARETAQMAKRIADNQRMLQKYEDQLQEILEQQKEELILSVTEVEIHADVAVENNQDQETETEYEFE